MREVKGEKEGSDRTRQDRTGQGRKEGREGKGALEVVRHSMDM